MGLTTGRHYQEEGAVRTAAGADSEEDTMNQEISIEILGFPRTREFVAAPVASCNFLDEHDRKSDPKNLQKLIQARRVMREAYRALQGADK
jgi:hypothetical protein